MTVSDRLFPFQRDGVRALVERPALLLADDMGLGKTVQAATALAQLVDRGDVRRALILAPRSVLSQWRRALEEWAPRLSAIRVEGPCKRGATVAMGGGEKRLSRLLRNGAQ